MSTKHSSLIDRSLEEIREANRIKSQGIGDSDLTADQTARLKEVTKLLNLLNVRLTQYPVLCDDLIIDYVITGNLSHTNLIACLEIISLADKVRGI